ncbi:MAG: helix-turn-helix domain-containing protein [Caldisericales bacterium]|nr:helix-turn-helix domain-containing protein [Caldisericales bacterium]
MAKRKFKLTPQETKEIMSAYNSCKVGQTKIRYQAVRLYGQGYATAEIEQITNCSRSSLMEWIRAYQKYGVQGLVDKRAGGNSAKLSKLQIEELGLRLHQYTPEQILGKQTHSMAGQFWTIEDLQKAIKKWYQVEYTSRGSLQHLFRACGFSFHRPERVFKSRREAQVMEFEEQVEKN